MTSHRDDNADHPTPRRDNRFFLVPALTFLIGLALGGVLVWVGDVGGGTGGEDDPQAQPSQTTSAPNPQATTPDVTVTVPGSCVEAAERSQQVLDLASQAARAIGDLDARELQEIVAQMQDLEPTVRDAATRCQELAGAGASTSTGTD